MINKNTETLYFSDHYNLSLHVGSFILLNATHTTARLRL
jgi:hypothetical protein